MAYECIIYEKLGGGIGLVTLNRPHRLNALSVKMREELQRLLDEVEKDEEVRAIVITGAPRPDGRPCFCSGADLKETAAAPPDSAEGRMSRIVRHVIDPKYETDTAAICSRVENLSKPSIAAIDGVCTAGGLELALSCDIRVVSETAQISDLHIKNLKSIGGSGVTARLARTVGLAWAKEIMFSGEPLDGHGAVGIGLANHVYPAGKLLDGALALARNFAAMDPTALALAKSLINEMGALELERALRSSYIGAAALVSEEREWALRRKQE
ncbi:MAG: enoyl-CoA hydratase/isomerase family protein [Chloroflexi bacterium]|nr:enoyl-CoA hydratase/isomerase family protein [Chloroflexota bacterium]